jgi:hypothetical protein
MRKIEGWMMGRGRWKVGVEGWKDGMEGGNVAMRREFMSWVE